MSVFTFTGTMIADMNYQLDDRDIVNDVILIDGDPGSEQVIRGTDTTSIARYARRSKRLSRPLAADAVTGEALVDSQLDKYCFAATNPMCRLSGVRIPLVTDTLIAAALALKISEQVTIQIAVMGMDEDFWVDDISYDIASGKEELMLNLVEVA